MVASAYPVVCSYSNQPFGSEVMALMFKLMDVAVFPSPTIEKNNCRIPFPLLVIVGIDYVQLKVSVIDPFINLNIRFFQLIERSLLGKRVREDSTEK
jgi:hypothetical protein